MIYLLSGISENEHARRRFIRDLIIMNVNAKLIWFIDSADDMNYCPWLERSKVIWLVEILERERINLVYTMRSTVIRVCSLLIGCKKTRIHKNLVSSIRYIGIRVLSSLIDCWEFVPALIWSYNLLACIILKGESIVK